MDETLDLWRKKDATLSDKSAQNEYGLSYEEILEAIKAGELQFREGSMYGNPWFRLLRVEVERLVKKKYGAGYLKEQKAKKKLSAIDRELKALKKRISELENEKKELLA